MGFNSGFKVLISSERSEQTHYPARCDNTVDCRFSRTDSEIMNTYVVWMFNKKVTTNEHHCILLLDVK